MRKKILVNYIGKSGGGPAFAYEFAKGLAKNGCDVYVIMSLYVDNKKEWDTCKLFKDVYYVKTNKNLGLKYKLKAELNFNLAGKKELKRHYKNVKFDYVITTMTPHPWSMYISKVVNADTIMWICHDPIPHTGANKLYAYLTNRFAKLADKTIVLTKSYVPIVKERWGLSDDQVVFMPHGRQCMYNKYDTEESMYGEKTINFLFFGYIRKYKGLHILAEAYKNIKNRYNNVTLTIAGSGDFSEYKSDFDGVKDVFVYNRYIRDDEIPTFFKGPNVVTVMPYTDATQSGISLTAMEFGSLIIASDTGGLREQLDEGKIGLYCNPGDVDSLVIQMEKVIKDQSLFDKERYKMKEYLKKLDWTVVTKKLLNEI